MSRRLLLPITQVRDATRRISSGDYAARVPLPPERELAELATDVNTHGREALPDGADARAADRGRRPRDAHPADGAGRLRGGDDRRRHRGDAVVVSQDMATETRRLRRLAEDFSSLAKAQERRFDLALEPRDLADIVTAAATRMGPQLEDEGIELALSVPPLPVTADEDRIMQVVTNLGWGTPWRPRGAEATIRIAGRQEGGWAAVDVADTGVGLRTRRRRARLRAASSLRTPAGAPPAPGSVLTISREPDARPWWGAQCPLGRTRPGCDLQRVAP